LFNFQKINNVDLELKYTFSELFLKKIVGTGAFFSRQLELRFEVFPKSSLALLNREQQQQFYLLLRRSFPQGLYFNNYLLVSILFLDFSYSYRGWRHLMGLPVNGQRTWSNANTTYASNKFLRDYKFKMGKLFFGRAALGDAKLALMSEYLNMLWRKQWFLE